MAVTGRSFRTATQGADPCSGGLPTSGRDQGGGGLQFRSGLLTAVRTGGREALGGTFLKNESRGRETTSWSSRDPAGCLW